MYCVFFCFNAPPPTEFYTYLHTMSLHDALPISPVAWYGEVVATLNGFRYVGEEPGQPATPGAADLEDRIDALRAATRIEGKDPWRACVVKLDKASGKASVVFAYEDADSWRVTPQTAADVARRARP